MEKLKAPFPWFGGKSKVAHIVWQALGDIEHYVEPFAGSLSVLLGRPTAPRIETVNDLDMWIVNFWRALQHDPAQVAHYANNPVNEADLTARHIWLVNSGRERIARIQGDPDWYDAKVAGWWVWGICCWIGASWCAGNGPWSSFDGQLIHLSEGHGVSRRRVSLGRGRGVSRQRVQLGNAGIGVNRRRFHLGNAGRGDMPGVLRTSVHDEPEPHGVDTGEAEICAYLNELAERLRYVRVCCGDWRRVITPGALSHGDPVGVFLDPPYDLDERGDGLYNTDDENGYISGDVRQWCIENAHNPRYRIVLAGYESEHEMPADWRVIEWTAGRAYGRTHGDTDNSDNRKRERLWLSPNCLDKQNGHRQAIMF